MKVLTVRQPWAWDIVHGGKDVENRSRNVAGRYRGPLAIHAGLRADREALRDLPRLHPSGIPRVFRYGAIIGGVYLQSVHHHSECASEPNGACSPWALPGFFHLRLEHPWALPEAVPFVGALGLRTIVDPNVLAALGAQNPRSLTESDDSATSATQSRTATSVTSDTYC